MKAIFCQMRCIGKENKKLQAADSTGENMARGQGKRIQVQARAKVQAKTAMKAQANNVVFSLDIGTRSIIGMVGIVEDGKVKIIAVEKEEHAERAMMDGQIENIEKVSVLAEKVKKRLEDKARVQLSRVCVAAAGRALKTKRAEFELELPGTQLIDDEIISRLEAGAISRAEEAFDAENEAQEDFRRFYLVGYTVCQYFLDQYMISNLKDHRGRQLKVDLIATFLPSEVVESLYTTMHKIGLEVASLTLEPIAAINAAIPENIRLLNLVMVDIGAGTSDIAACTSGSVTGYTMATMAGDEITETIMKQYLVDFQTAESIKMQLDRQEEIEFKDILGMSKRLSAAEVTKSIRGAFEALSKEIADKVVEINKTAPSALFLVGGGCKLAGLKDGITEALGMDGNRVTIAGNYFQTNAFSEEYDLNNPEYATPLGILISSGLNLINDSFRVTLNNKPAKLFRSGSFTALNLLMMNGYNFRDIMGRPGLNLTVMVNGTRKVFLGTASDPASLFINQREGKLSDVIHAGDQIEFIPASRGVSAKACLGDIEGARECEEITLNGRHVSLDTELKTGDTVVIRMPKKAAPVSGGESQESEAGRKAGTDEEKAGQAVEEAGPEAAKGEEEKVKPEAAKGEEEKADPNAAKGEEEKVKPEAAKGEEEKVKPEAAKGEEEKADPGIWEENKEALGKKAKVLMENKEALGQRPQIPEENKKTAGIRQEAINAGADAAKQEGEGEAGGRPALEEAAKEETRTLYFELNGAPLNLPLKKDGRPYYLMDLIQYSGIDLDHPKGAVFLEVNGEEGRFQQVLREGDRISIKEEQR